MSDEQQPGRHRAETWRNAESGYSCEACKAGEHHKCTEHVQWGLTDGGPCDCWSSNGDRHRELRLEVVRHKLGDVLHQYLVEDFACDHDLYAGDDAGADCTDCQTMVASEALQPVVAALVKGGFYR